eukprot:TRINITY_DN10636_c0_g1_i2.p1 TRINITY_DN10636_c0_g1~~TRINITY_DN10636_c0_g1_i2.p1  ORF type:complete len:118 (-),score=21.08 TRINITY_DN10636_c0_g1_i2:16-369(-)
MLIHTVKIHVNRKIFSTPCSPIHSCCPELQKQSNSEQDENNLPGTRLCRSDVESIRVATRERQRKYWQKNKEVINQRRRAGYRLKQEEENLVKKEEMSGGAMILIFIVEGAKLTISF